MTFRARLTLFFVGIVVLPLVAATLAYQVLNARQAEARTNTRLDGAAHAAVALWEERLRLIQHEVGFAAERLAPEVGAPSLGERIDSIRILADLDVLVASDTSGVVLAATQEPPVFLAGRAAPTPAQIATEPEPAGLLLARVDVVAGDQRAVVTGGRYADQTLARELADATGLGVALVEEGTVLASTVQPPPAVVGEIQEDSRQLLIPVGGPGDGVLLLAPIEEASPAAFWLIAVAGLLAATILGYSLARVIAQPLQRLAEGARGVAAGDLGTRLEVGERGDVARVAESFNTMTEYLRTYIGELEESRDELRRNLERMGSALRTTLDLEGMMKVVLDTAAVTLGSRAAAMFLLSPTGQEIRLEVARGYDPPRNATLTPGTGIAGRAATGSPVLLPGGPQILPAMPVEPDASTAVAVPLIRRDRTIGVIALYGRTTLEPFGEGDVDTLSSFAGQASVAIENVLLYQETQQLSITDGLTGVWNRRYLELTLRKEIDRANRFGRTLSVLMVDIDRFKRVNDRHGHRRGDEVLIEVTQRVVGSIRTQIDFVARYGGEEFIIVLPETPCDGAVVVAEKIRQAIRDQPFDAAMDSITVSVGVASFPIDGATAEDLVQAADTALYRAKRGGRDRVEAASSA